MKPGDAQAGYMLITLSIALVVIGTLLAGALPLWTALQEKQRFAREQHVIAAARAAIDDFFQVSGRYPCPAPPGVPASAAEAGNEDCGASGLTVAAGTGGLDVLVGTLPYKTVGLARQDVRNPYNGSAITYAVTRRQTDAATYADAGGVSVEEQTTQPDGTALLRTIDDPDFVLVSHGKANDGSFLLDSGVPVGACPSGASEGANCDGDAAFRAFLRAVDFDDLVAYSTGPLVTRPAMAGTGVWYTAAVERSGGAARVGGSYTEAERGSHIFSNVRPGAAQQVTIPLTPMDVFLRIEAACSSVSSYGNLPPGGQMMNRTLLSFHDRRGAKIPWNVEQVCARLAGGHLGPNTQQTETQIRLLVPVPPAATSARIEAQIINDTHTGFRFFSAVIRATRISGGGS